MADTETSFFGELLKGIGKGLVHIGNGMLAEDESEVKVEKACVPLDPKIIAEAQNDINN